MQEINELKNLVVQSLESHGVLSQLRAQIRSSVFKIIDMQETQNNKKTNSFFWENPFCQKIYENDNGLLAVEVITEFLQFYKMDYTLNVFPHESNLKDEVTREKIWKKLAKNEENEKDKGIPVLIHLINFFLSNLNLGSSSQERKNIHDIKKEESKEEFKIKEKDHKNEIKQNETDLTTKNKDFSLPQKKEVEHPREIQDFKKQEIKEQKQQAQPVPMMMEDPFSKKEFQGISQKESSNNEINKEKKTFAETQQKLGDIEKKINSKQIAEIPTFQNKKEKEEKPSQPIPLVPEKKEKVIDIKKQQQEEFEKKKEEISKHYEDEHFDDYNEEVNEEIFHEDENIEELMYRQQEGNMEMHGQQGLQSSDDNFGVSQSQGFDILVNSQTLEEYDYYEDVLLP